MTAKKRFDPRVDLQNYREALKQILEKGPNLPRDLMPSPLNEVVIPVDMLDNGTELVIKASLPGVKPEDVSVSVLEDMLTIRAKPGDDEEEARGSTYLRRERRTTAYVRTLRLPLPVITERAAARCKNGVLTLTLPKRASTRPRVIRATDE